MRGLPAEQTDIAMAMLDIHTDKVTAVLQHAAKKCCRLGLKLTEKRSALLAVLVAADVPLSAYEILEHYNATQDRPMPAMSAYRMLDFLASVPLVHKLASDNKYIACAHIKCSHEHQVPQFLICKVCGRIKELVMQQAMLATLKSHVAALGYQLVSSHIELDCLCQDCQVV